MQILRPALCVLVSGLAPSIPATVDGMGRPSNQVTPERSRRREIESGKNDARPQLALDARRLTARPALIRPAMSPLAWVAAVK
jgi:hypothetical protein